MRVKHFCCPAHADRFWQSVDMRGPDECWPWKGGTNGHGYGACGYANRRSNASRVAYIMAHGEPETIGKVVCHRCDNPICCNPAHLWLGTHGDNVRDCVRKGRQRLKFGAAHHRSTAKLTPVQVLEVRALHRNKKLTYSEIGRIYGVHNTTIRSMVIGESWKHVA